MKVLVNTKNLSLEEWLDWRKKGIGGSDVGAIVGLNKYTSAFTLYLDKLNELPSEHQQSESAYWGSLLEETVAAEFSKRTGLETRERNELLQHDKYAFMIANLDREVICPDRGIGILECKTADKYFLSEWEEDKVPDTYYLQVQHYLAVTGYQFAYIAVLIGGNTFVHKEVIRDEEVINYLYHLESNFWNEHVLKGVPPAIDGSDSSTSSLKLIYSESSEESTELDDSCFQWIKELHLIKAQIKTLETEKQELENNIRNSLGNYSIGTYEGSEVVTWKANKRGSRTLNLKKMEVS